MAVLSSVVRMGDSTSHGGLVVEGFPQATWDVDGIPAAGVGHAVTCPIHPGVHYIAEGTSIVTVEGVPVALDGMKTSCGATLIASQQIASAEGLSTVTLSNAGESAWSTAAFAAADSGYSELHSHDQRFQLIDEVTGGPVANRAYRITINGQTYDGTTDDSGRSQRISADGPSTVTIEIFAEGL